MQVEMRRLSEIHPYPQNPRKNEAAVSAVAESIRVFGFQQPLVLNKGGVIVIGHTRYKAALQLGLETVPVVVAHRLTAAQERALRLADNQTARLAEWDLEQLSLELTALQSEGFDLDLIGFPADELLSYLNAATVSGECDPDEIPAAPDEAMTRPGDLWLLDKHRLLCGDSSKAEDVDRLLDGKPVHLVTTDPPYGVGVEPRSNNAVAAGLSTFAKTKNRQRVGLTCRPPVRATKLRAKDRPLINDFVPDEEFAKLLKRWFGNLARVLLPGRGFYIWGGYGNCANYPPVLQASELYFSQAIIWVKEHAVLTRKDYMGNHELCFYGWRMGAAHVFLGPNNATDVWSVKKVNPQNMVHLTEKPVELARRALEYSSRPGEHVLDLFAGSGGVLVAAEQTSRRAFAMEIDPLYCDVAVDRWERFTGKKAKRN